MPPRLNKSAGLNYLIKVDVFNQLDKNNRLESLKMAQNNKD